ERRRLLIAQRLLAPRLDRRKRGEYAISGEVLRQHRKLIVRISLERRLHLLEMRHVRLAQHQADVRIGDEMTRAVDDVGFALLADLDARDDVPDELEVNV